MSEEGKKKVEPTVDKASVVIGLPEPFTPESTVGEIFGGPIKIVSPTDGIGPNPPSATSDTLPPFIEANLRQAEAVRVATAGDQDRQQEIQRQKISAFFAWLDHTKGLYLAEWVREPGRGGAKTLQYTRESLHTLMAEFFQVEQQ